MTHNIPSMETTYRKQIGKWHCSHSVDMSLLPGIAFVQFCIHRPPKTALILLRLCKEVLWISVTALM
jgi:hypothetical protein